MNPNSGRFLSRKWVFIVFAIIASILAPFVPSVLAEEQTDTPAAEGGEHPVFAPGDHPGTRLVLAHLVHTAGNQNGQEIIAA